MKLVNATSTEQPVNLKLNGMGAAAHPAPLETLKAKTTWATNSIANPNRIVPTGSMTSIKGERLQHVMPPYSIQVLQIDLK